MVCLGKPKGLEEMGGLLKVLCERWRNQSAADALELDEIVRFHVVPATSSRSGKRR
jgi:hypothetical protein